MKKIIQFSLLLVIFFSLTSCQEKVEEVIIHFDANNGSEVFSVSILSETDYLLPESPVKEGYLFDGWYMDEAMTLLFDEQEINNDGSDITLYAKWIQQDYSLNFVTNSVVPIDSIIVTVGSTILLPPLPGDESNTFYGWYTDAAFTLPFEDYIMPAHDVTLYAKWTDSIFYYTLNEEDEAIITGIIPDAINDELIVPEMIDNHPVVSINYEAFSGYTNIVSLILPNSLRELSVGVLHDQHNLMFLSTPFLGTHRMVDDSEALHNVVLGTMFVPNTDETVLYDAIIPVYQSYVPYSLLFVDITDTRIVGSFSFANTNVQRITLYEGLEEIHRFAFENANNITALTIPYSVSLIEAGAFASMEYLSYIFIDDLNPFYSTNELSSIVFNKDQTELIAFVSGKLILSAEIPSTVTHIHAYAFAFSQISSIFIPSAVTEIDHTAFYGSRLSEIIFEENSSLETISSYSFANTGLTSIVIPNSVTLIENEAFQWNTSLKQVYFEAGSTLSSIGSFAFKYNIHLQSIIIPATVEYIGSSAFYGDFLATIYLEVETKPMNWNDDWDGTISEDNIVWGYTPQ